MRSWFSPQPAYRPEDSTSATLTKIRWLFGASLLAPMALELFVAYWLTSGDHARRFLILNLVLGGAAGFSGGLLGFIFGVPKSLTDSSENDTNAARHSGTNTNLEQISDWLTKVLVGAGLTSLTALPHFGARIIHFLDKNGYEGLPGGGTLAIFIILYFAAAGFFWSYVETRTSLTKLFNEVDQPLPRQTLQVIRTAPAEPRSQPIPEDSEILNRKPADLNSVELLDARGSAEIRARQWPEAIQTLRRALNMAPTNQPIITKLTQTLSAARRTDEAQKLIDESQAVAVRAGNTAAKNRSDLNEMFNALYQPGGFTRAIAIGAGLLETDQGSNGNLHLWLARAYGQRAAEARKQGQPFDADRQAALERLAAMKKLRPDLLPVARSMWRPAAHGGAKEDDDLEVFANDEEFARLLVA